MPAIYRHRKVTLKGSPYIGRIEKWKPLVRDGQYVLAHRFTGPRRHEVWNTVLVATLEAAIDLLRTGRYCIRMLGDLTGKDALLAPGSLIIEP